MRKKFSYKALTIALNMLVMITSSIVATSMTIDRSSNPNLFYAKNKQTVVKADFPSVKNKVVTIDDYKNDNFVDLTRNKQSSWEAIFNNLSIYKFKYLFDSSFNKGIGYINIHDKYIYLIKQQFVSKLLNVPTTPSYSSLLEPTSKPKDNSWYKIFVLINAKEKHINFAVYAWNPIIHSYQIVSKTTNDNDFLIGSNNVVNIMNPVYNKHETNWVIPVAISCPIFIVLLALFAFCIFKYRRNKYCVINKVNVANNHQTHQHCLDKENDQKTMLLMFSTNCINANNDQKNKEKVKLMIMCINSDTKLIEN